MNIEEYSYYHEKKPHVDSRFPYNTYLCSIPLDFIAVPVHWHDEVELVVIKKGCGIVSVDLEAKKVGAGDIVLIVPGQLHSIEQDGSHGMEYENILFQPRLVMTASEDICDLEFWLPFFEGRIRFPSWIDESNEKYSQLALCIDSIDKICSERPFGYQLSVKGYLYQFFYLLSGSEREVICAGTGVKSLDKMKMIVQKIERDYNEKITIEDMADAVGFSPSHFMKYFKMHMGVSFVDYLNDYRLTMASRLLIGAPMDVISIAMETGFSNISYFNRLFKKKFHVTPSVYREQNALHRSRNMR